MSTTQDDTERSDIPAADQAAFEAWTEHKFRPAYEAYRANRSQTLTADEVRATVAAELAKIKKGQ